MKACTAWTMSSGSWLLSLNSRPWIYDKKSWMIGYMVSPCSQKVSANIVMEFLNCGTFCCLSLSAPCHFQDQTLAESSQGLISRDDTFSSSVGKPCFCPKKIQLLGYWAFNYQSGQSNAGKGPFFSLHFLPVSKRKRMMLQRSLVVLDSCVELACESCAHSSWPD